MKANYTDISKTYDKYRSYSEKEIKKIIEFARIREGTRILDVGCGTGNVAVQLKKLIEVDVVGIDISMPMLEVARGKSLKVVCADAGSGHLPFRDNSFDMTIGAYIVHQIDNLQSMFSECCRVLGSGAIVLFTSSHRQIEYQHPVIKQFFPSLIDIDKARFPDIPEIDRRLGSAGFTDIRHEEIRVENIPMDDEYLQKVKGKYVSTYHLLPQKEFEAGVKRLEAFIRKSHRTEFREWRGTLIYGKKKG